MVRLKELALAMLESSGTCDNPDWTTITTQTIVCARLLPQI
jgi:hypothetical protein